jgi:hypothetical protein
MLARDTKWDNSAPAVPIELKKYDEYGADLPELLYTVTDMVPQRVCIV